MRFPDLFNAGQNRSVTNLLTFLLQNEMRELRGLQRANVGFGEMEHDMIEADFRATVDALQLVQAGPSLELAQALKQKAASKRQALTDVGQIEDVRPRVRTYAEATADFYDLFARVIEADLSL